MSCALGCTGMLIGQARYKIWHQKHLVRTQAQKKISLQKITTKTAPSPILEKRSHLWEARTSGKNWKILLVMKTDCTRDLFTQGCLLYLKSELSVTTNSIHSVIQGSLLFKLLHWLQHNPRRQISNHNKIKNSFLNLLHLGKISLYNIHNLPTPLQQLITKSHHTLLLW